MLLLRCSCIMAFHTTVCLLFSAILQLGIITSLIIPDVEELQGISDYRSVILVWKYNKKVQNGFIVRYCEIGLDTRRHLCAMKVLNESDNNVLTPGDNNPRRYSTIIDGLRLSTGYYFDVIPIQNEQTAYLLSANVRTDTFPALTSGLYLSTKGFRAKVTKCLKEYTEIEIDTGPNFGGIVEVEGSTDPRCSLMGDKSRVLSKYILIVTHQLCGSRTNGRFVESIIVVNENPTVITQSSRRFNVVCDIIPENQTLHAIINVPLEVLASPDPPPPMVWQQNSSPDNNIRKENARMLERNFEESMYQSSTEGTGQVQLIIVGAMVMTALLIIGMATWLWWRHRRKGSSDSTVDRAQIIPTNEPQDSSEYVTNNNNNNNNENFARNQDNDVSLTSHRALHFY